MAQAQIKSLPISERDIERAVEKFPTPFHLYDEKGILENVRRLKKAFAWNAGFREFFAVKATPNPFLMKLLGQELLGMDCSSLPELLLSQHCGVVGERIMFTSNDTPSYEVRKAFELGAIINLDDLSHIPFVVEACGGVLPQPICCRFNPGPERTGNVIIGNPADAKYGFTREQLFEGYQVLRDAGAKRFGLHTMVASNELDPSYFLETVRMLLQLVKELEAKIGIEFEFINMGGGIGIPYRPEQKAVNLEELGASIRGLFEENGFGSNGRALHLYMECGRVITGPYGCLVSRVLHKKHIYKDYIGLDASMANLMRPGMYGAYHHISVVGKGNLESNHNYDVTGSLCENNDKFAVDRRLPEIEVGDVVVIHDAGAHGHAMGFNYNGKLRSAEILLRTNGELVQIRRAETPEDLFITLDLNALDCFQ